jgi:predicted DNA-binding protein with PD1-like motif
MKIIQKVENEKQNNYVVTIARGEEVFSELQKLIEQEKIACATFTGLGAVDKIEIAYYNLQTKEYERTTIEEELELLSIVGNLAYLDGTKPILHIHGVFGKRDLSTLGGHLFSMKISGACEIHLTTYPEKIGRAFDSETGLNLICKL